MSQNPYEAPKSEIGSDLRISPYGEVRDISVASYFSVASLSLCLCINILCYLMPIDSDYFEYLNFQNSSDQFFSYELQSTGLQYFMYLEWMYVISGLLATITISIWTYGAMVNTWAVVKMKPTISPGWAVGWYFIPFANFWKPYEAMLEIWRGLYGQQKSQVILLLWWLCWIFSLIIDTSVDSNMIIPNRVSIEAEASIILNSAAAVLLIGIIITITKGQKKFKN